MLGQTNLSKNRGAVHPTPSVFPMTEMCVRDDPTLTLRYGYSSSGLGEQHATSNESSDFWFGRLRPQRRQCTCSRCSSSTAVGTRGTVPNSRKHDHTGCLRTGTSSSGGANLLGSHPLRSWSSTHSVAALPSGEAEYCGLVRSASILLGIVSLVRDMGLNLKGTLWTDSSAGKGIANQQGVGKVQVLA